MAAIKSCTDIPQSKKLAEILPLESADMFLALDGLVPVMSKYIDNGLVTADETAIPCWSLAALLSVLSDYTLQTTKDRTVFVVCESKKPMISDEYDNPVDACVEIIIKLHEQNLL